MKLTLAALAKNKKVIVSTASAISFLAGVAVGVKVTKKKLEAKYEELTEQEISEARRFYSALHKAGKFETPEAAAETLMTTEVVDSFESYQGHHPSTPLFGATVEAVRHPALIPVIGDGSETAAELIAEGKAIDEQFGETDFDDYEAEVKNRDTEKPYILGYEEFIEAEFGWEQTTVTYFEGDDVLADDRDVIIDDVDMTVGLNNLQRFGHGSRDNNVLYIRNERLELELEVVRSTGKYAEVILGFIEHSDPIQRNRKFRKDQ